MPIRKQIAYIQEKINNFFQQMSDLLVKKYTAENTAHLRGKTGKLTREKTANFPVKMGTYAGGNASIKVMLFKKNVVGFVFYKKTNKRDSFSLTACFMGFISGCYCYTEGRNSCEFIDFKFLL